MKVQANILMQIKILAIQKLGCIKKIFHNYQIKFIPGMQGCYVRKYIKVV